MEWRKGLPHQRIPTSTKVMPKGDAVERLAACMHLVLDLDDKYPHNSLAAQWHIVSNAKRF
jgi:hypothetical protein